jgi:uncharacterized membrane protein YdbT with pleckstrin-like domain
MKFPEKGVIYKASPRAFVWNYVIAAGIVFLSFLVFSRFELGETAPYGYLVVAAVLVYLCGEPFIIGFFRYYVISSSEVSEVSGVLWKKRHSVPYQGIADVRVIKGLLGRILDYGTVEIVSVGENVIEMKHVGNPGEVQRLLRHRIDGGRNTTGGRQRAQSKEEPDETGEILDEAWPDTKVRKERTGKYFLWSPVKNAD